MGEFVCEYAKRGQTRCPEWRCDCFIDLHPDDPLGLHPEAFVVGTAPPGRSGTADHEARP